MRHAPKPLQPQFETLELSRLFVRELGWSVALKHGSDREFCFTQAPGEQNYHRLADGEIYLVRGDEKICLPCAGRMGLLRPEPKALRDPARGPGLSGPEVEPGPGYDVAPPRA